MMRQKKNMEPTSDIDPGFRLTDIAIVGMACRFPQADHYTTFWDNLANGVDSVKEIPPDRWDVSKFYSQDIDAPNKSIGKWCGLLDDVYSFDHRFFSISPREAKNMDPQQRMMLEVSWQCIEDSGISLQRLQNQITSVYAGVMTVDHRQMACLPELEIDSYACLGNYESILANRISYIMDFKGASISVNAACASSLVAVHEAKQALQRKECNYALAACVNLNLHPWKFISFSKSRMLSPDGRCKTFDKEANGYVPGDGAGVLLLQRLEDALAEGNHIYGVIKGSACNHGGRSASITAPSMRAQQDVILAAYQDADISPEMVTYIEAHGTGTSLGDPIEIEALKNAFAAYTSRTQFCRIGSVKTNIGHLESAAGMAGIVKVIMMMKHGKIPANLHFNDPNPIIDFKNTPFEVAGALTDWNSAGEGLPLRAGISSFGFGGVNAHLVIEQWCTAHSNKQKDAVAARSQLFTLSGKSKWHLEKQLESWRAFSLTSEFDECTLRDISGTLSTGRVAFPYRYAVMVDNLQQLKEELHSESSRLFMPKQQKWAIRVGHFSYINYEQFSKLTRGLPHVEDIIQSLLNQIADSDRPLADHYRQMFYNEPWEQETLPCCQFIAGYAVLRCLLDAGLKVEWMTGEHTGMWAVLAVNQMIAPEEILLRLSGKNEADFIKLHRPCLPYYDPTVRDILYPMSFGESYLRRLLGSSQIESVDSGNSEHDRFEYPMVSDHERVKYYLTKGQSLIAHQFTFRKYVDEWSNLLGKVSGDDWNLEELLGKPVDVLMFTELSTQQLFIIVTVVAYSLRKLNRKWNLTIMAEPDPRFEEMLDLMNDHILLPEMVARLVLDSNVDYKVVAESMNLKQRERDMEPNDNRLCARIDNVPEIVNVEQWLHQTQESQVDLEKISSDIKIIDIGVVQSAAPDTLKLALKEDEAGYDFWNILGQLWLHGVNVRWDLWFPSGTFNKLALPTQRFESVIHRLHDHNDTVAHVANQSVNDVYMLTSVYENSLDRASHPMIGRNTSTLDEFKYQTLFTGKEFFLNDHRVDGKRTLPGVAYLEMALAAVQNAGIQEVIGFGDVVWSRPLIVMEQPVEVNISLSKTQEKIQFHVWTGEDVNPRKVYGQGTLYGIKTDGNKQDTRQGNPNRVKRDIDAIRGRCVDPISGVYRKLEKSHLVYGPSFQSIMDCCMGENEAIARFVLPIPCYEQLHAYTLHPVVMDSALQTAMLLAQKVSSAPCMPYSIGAVKWWKRLPDKGSVYVRQQGTQGEKAFKFDIVLLDEQELICMEMSDFTVRQVRDKKSHAKDPLKTLLRKLEAGEVEPIDVLTYMEER
ncbi:beta-ketoacyl synthase N-terminal-like domain-containing protein [Paenibacillus xylanexedens]|uniref:type I polyketide synthase n=1 Tax=Paenibacillus xylanexedens TaxID=528191 RepID=UPI001C8DD86A|nr:beta-ketoacyl synthase N-terminal-like domain-containing protein [Paenibacillus xylanexedens]MBY0119543.1 polyketide synthase dehydratase domain-containing protein [Paenibacillus xylanexedens]